MSGYNLSIVLLIPAAYVDALDDITDGMGWGRNNLSIALNDGEWFGGHTMAAPGFLEDFANAPAEASPVLAQLIMSVHDTTVGESSGIEHWDEALEANGLSIIEQPDQMI